MFGLALNRQNPPSYDTDLTTSNYPSTGAPVSSQRMPAFRSVSNFFATFVCGNMRWNP
ncbi:hypothetical protein TRAPUB_11476 [Trametes pubescens]|uniref:Uncharacterized protein n=1 Tax=Trametes pubescens TaxID=154538 RepID=A0A1M2VWK8_TRAPU|nr:hypothetical protein TRAPUB_11476 [Trametes pubescens]